jgi:hypothetical protein
LRAKNKHYASVDQYNLFSDLTTYVHPFLLKEDKNQIEYKKVIEKNNNKVHKNLTEKILKNL